MCAYKSRRFKPVNLTKALIYSKKIPISFISFNIQFFSLFRRTKQMSQSSEVQSNRKRSLSEKQSDQVISKAKKKVKQHKFQKQDDSDSDEETHKHKKHKKSRSKSKKHKQKSQKKHKKQKQKKSKHKKDKNHKKKSDESSEQKDHVTSQILQEQSSSGSIQQEIKKKLKKIKSNGSTKAHRSTTPGRISRISRRKSKNDAIVSASQDQDKPYELDKQSDEGSGKDHSEEKSKSKPKKRRSRKLKEQQQKPGQQSFQIDDVINLDGEQNHHERNQASESLAKMTKKKIDRLTKIKQPVIKNIIVTKNVQNVPVDHHFSKFNQCHVFQMGGCFYNATLTQSNIVRDDNKFFIIQILQMNHNQEEFYVYSRWGRVGVTGQISELGPLNRQASIRHYNQVVQNKIKIGHYKVVEMNYDDYDKNKKEKGNKQLQIPSKLDLRVQDLIKLIFDIRMMNSHMKEIGYDEKRLPLGKLGEKTITEGYHTLDRLMTVIKDKSKEAFQKKKQINELSGLFYQCIPHDFGYMNMQTFVLDTEEKIKQKLQILSSLQEIQIYNSLISEKYVDPQLSEVDQKYYRLGINISPVIKGSQVWKKLIKYVQNTHAKTHNKYDLEVEEIYELKKEQMEISYKKEIGKKMLLWHGSRLTNYVGILSKGLKIAPLQAPSTGYMFGKGIYFADMVSKSANYCLASKINNIGLVLLCEVALGNITQKFQADYNAAANRPPGTDSVKGMGQTQPMGGQMLDDVWIPNGKAQPSGVVDSTLLYNEYVVYDPKQIKYRYLFRFKFHFKVSQNILPGIRV